MREFIQKDDAVIQAAGVVREKQTISKAGALAAGTQVFDNMFGTEIRNISEDSMALFVDATVRYASASGSDEDLSFATLKTPLELARELQQRVAADEMADLANHALGGVLPNAPAPQATPAFVNSTIGKRSAIAMTIAPVLTEVRKAELRQAVAREMAEVLAVVKPQRTSTPVAKSHTVRIIKTAT